MIMSYKNQGANDETADKNHHEHNLEFVNERRSPKRFIGPKVVEEIAPHNQYQRQHPKIELKRK